MSIPKNAAFLLVFPLLDATTGLLKPGATVTGQTVSLDGAGFGACTNAVAEISGGYYSLQLTAAEMNAQVVAVKVAATGALTMTATITTDDVQARLPATLVGGRMNSSVGAVANGAIAAAAFAVGAFDAVFTRALSAVEGSAPGRSLAGAIAKLVNKVVLSGGTLSVKQTDDATDMFTQAAGTDASAEPVVSLDTN
jgi:hypothetical protein